MATTPPRSKKRPAPPPPPPAPTLATTTADYAAAPIGLGCQAAVFAATAHDGAQCAIKIERGAEAKLAAKLVMERRFQAEVAAYHPAFFIQLYDSRPMAPDEPRPEYKLTTPMRLIPRGRQGALRDAAAGDAAIIRLHDFIPRVFRDLPRLPPHELCAAIVQITAAVRLMAMAGYAHRDLHSANIGVRDTHNTHIRIRGHNIPTYGRAYPIIDMGSLAQVKQISGKRQRHMDRMLMNNDASALIMLMYRHRALEYLRRKGIKYDYGRAQADFEEQPKYAHIREKYDKRMWIAMYETMYPAEYSQQIAGRRCGIKYFVPMEHIEWFARHYNDHIAVIDYFAELSRP